MRFLVLFALLAHTLACSEQGAANEAPDAGEPPIEETDAAVMEEQTFRRGSQNLRRISNLLAEYGAVMTVQVSMRWAEWSDALNGAGCEQPRSIVTSMSFSVRI